MFSFISNHKKKLAAVTVVALALFVPTVLVPKVKLYVAFSRGWFAARHDIAQGKFMRLTYGYPAPWSDDYDRLLQARYGIRDKRVAGCVVTERLNFYVHGYNRVIEAEAKKRFGRDVFAEAADEVESERKLAKAKATTDEGLVTDGYAQ